MRYGADKLSMQHRAALDWFEERAGTVTSWPDPLSDGTFLASKAKGIYKPSWTKYALSIRQSLGSSYPDVPPIIREDGSWLYMYFQEDMDPDSRDNSYTNLGMLACMKDGIPVGVFRQIKPKPRPEYLIEGIAFVQSWADGFFTLEGNLPDGLVTKESQASWQPEKDSRAARSEINIILDTRREVSVRTIKVRQGQTKFRQQLLDAYRKQCCATEYDAESALEAAHILPYRGAHTNHVSNGLLLRADIHNLFDLGLISIHPDREVILIKESLRQTKYSVLETRQIVLPANEHERPAKEALFYHANWAGLLS